MRINLFRKLIAIIILISSVTATYSQSVWNSNNFKFSKDVSPLDDMTGSTNVTFSSGIPASSPAVSFGSFAFRYGLSSYSNFYISPYGFIKLGSPISNNNPALDTSVISALYNGTSWNASYKTAGSAPNRKMVIEFSGVMQPSGEPTKYQIWLFERTGKIQLVYQQLRGFYGYSSSWHYRIFCKANIMNTNVIAGVRVNPNNALPAVNYTAPALSFDSIYALTRYTFQPDTVRPVVPSALTFSNVQAACLTVNITENSNNESMVLLERADSVTNYKTEKIYYPLNPTGSLTYNYSQASLRPFWNYNYRTYVSNGFLNSDTLSNTAQTLMPQINGVKTVPGDYPSITALLQDAACKHLGPNLVIELQNNYSFAAETLPLTFNSTLQNRFIQSIVIRPALNATVNWAASTSTALFYVDSVRHVYLDGRPGGIGTSQNFTIFQQNPYSSAIQYTNAADSGGVSYCKILKKNSSSLTYSIVVVPNNADFTRSKLDLNAFSLTNNFISADSALVSDLVYIKPADTSKGRDFIISGNQFSRFTRTAIHFENGGENLRIANNIFFQPVPVIPQVYLPETSASCISLLNTETATVDNNFFGGNSIVWGTGKYTLQSGNDFAFINYQNSSLTKKAFISNNKFGNISCAGNFAPTVKLIYALKGDVMIDHNQLGTSDSTNSITTSGFFWGMDVWYSNKTISNNYFSGFQGSYLTPGTSNDSYFISSSFTDSCAFLYNDIGGSNNPYANSSSGTVNGIETLVEKNITIKGNNLRGFSSRVKDVKAINGAVGITGTYSTKLEIDSNSIHHLLGPSHVIGVTVNVNSRNSNRISYNNIYSLKNTGTAGGSYGPEGDTYGIQYSMYNFDHGPVDYKGEVSIFGNKIHSFESLRSLSNSTFLQYGILATSPITKIFNNELRLGIDAQGHGVDSLTSLNGIIVSPVDYQTFLSDKHYIEHNSIYFGGRGLVGNAIAASYSYNYVSPKNLITVTNNIINIERNPGNNITPDMYEHFASIKTKSAKNIWYSVNIPNTPALLQTFKQSCHCDSSSFIGNPVFINPTGDSSNYNLHFGPLSKADSTGTPSVENILTDLDNKSRNSYSPVDIGCYAGTPCGTGAFPTITLTPAGDSVQLCSGGSITLNATISGGTFQTLQWQKDLIDSTGANVTSLTVNSPGSYRLVGTTPCGSVASSLMNVSSNSLQRSASIASSADSSCAGIPVTFTATAVNCGTNPAYQWKINSVNAGTNSPVFTSSTLNNHDTVKVFVTSNVCSVNNMVQSNSKIMLISSATPPIITISSTPASACTGTPIVFTATITNGGTVPAYQWQVNGINTGTNAPVFTSSSLNNNDLVKCILSGNAPCVSGAGVPSNIIIAAITTPVAPAVSISTPTPSACSGATVVFTVNSLNGGSSPAYQWKVNGINTGTNNAVFSVSNLNNGDQVSCVLTSNAGCITTAAAVSNNITMSISNSVMPTVSISASSTSICAGTLITFTATSTGGGATPAYQWQVNGVNSGSNSPTFSSSSLNNNDAVKIIMTGSLSCASTPTATSNIINVTVTPVPIANAGPDVSICVGNSAQLQASGGATYFWTPAAGLSNPNVANPVASPATTTTYHVAVFAGNCNSTDSVIVTVLQATSATVNISSAGNNACSGDPVSFSAAVTNAGTNPLYQWQVNGVNAGSNSPVFTISTLQDNDVIKVILTSNNSCASSAPVTSNTIIMHITSLAVPNVVLNNNIFTVTNPDAAAIYAWQVNGTLWNNVVPAATGLTYTATIPGSYRVKAEKGICIQYSTPQNDAFTATQPDSVFYVHPNPTQRFVTIEHLWPAKKWQQLNIKNMQGQVMAPAMNIRNQSRIIIDAVNFPPGMYFVNMINEEGKTFGFKFIKVN